MGGDPGVALSPYVGSAGHLRIGRLYSVFAALPERVGLAVITGGDVHSRDTAAALNVVENIGAEEQKIVIWMRHHIEARAGTRCRLHGAARRAEQDSQAGQ